MESKASSSLIVLHKRETVSCASLEKEQGLRREASRMLRSALRYSEYKCVDCFIAVVTMHEALEKLPSEIYWASN